MKNFMSSISQTCGKAGLRCIALSAVLLTLTACSEDEVGDGYILNTALPDLGFTLDLYCPDVGLADEGCILQDPNNRFARSAISNENKFDLYNTSPSTKESFYIWGTAQARAPSGENQFYTALSLHQLYTMGGTEADPDARAQAKRAYRSLLDNYFDSVTFSAPDANGNQTTFALKDWVGERIYSPGPLGLAQLFDSQADALANLNQWGYAYNPATKKVLRSTSQ